MQISGPSVWSHYELDHRQMNFFGERHKKTNLCENGLDFSTLLRRICEDYHQGGKYLDIFLESPFITERYPGDESEYWKSPTHASPLTDVLNNFASCLKEDKSECPYLPFVRFHYVDIRTVARLPIAYKFEAFLTGHYVHEINSVLDALEHEESYMSVKEMLDIFSAVTEFAQTEDYFQSYLYNHQRLLRQANVDLFWSDLVMEKIHKQLEAIPQYAQDVVDYFHRRGVGYFEDFHRLIHSSKWSQLLSTETRKEIFKHRRLLQRVRDTLLSLDGIFMDVYALARLLKTFSWADTGDILLFAGAAHIRNYEGFFDEVFNLQPDMAYIDYSEQCITGAHVEKVWGKYL